MGAAYVAVALASLSLALSTAALVSCGTMATRLRAQAPRAPLVPRLDLGGVAASEAGSRDGDWAESVSECDGEWEEGEWPEDDKENRPPG